MKQNQKKHEKPKTWVDTWIMDPINDYMIKPFDDYIVNPVMALNKSIEDSLNSMWKLIMSPFDALGKLF